MSPLFLRLNIGDIIKSLNGYFWGWGMILLILSTGVILSFKTEFVQLFHFKKALKLIFKTEKGDGEISPFAALCTSLSATVGTGNIVGVATAVSIGGPGSVFWMITAAFFGMATKYSEGVLAVKFRQKDQDGSYSGGPFCYIEKGLGKRYKPLSVLFAVFGVLAGVLGIGTLTQSNGITAALERFFDPEKEITVTVFKNEFSLPVIIGSIVITVFASTVIFGGLKRISKISQAIVPFMTVLYVVVTLLILICNIKNIPSAVRLIMTCAFIPNSIVGGAAGISVKTVIRTGIGRGIFSNEAGLGSAPIAAAATKTNEPVETGLVTMTGTFFDTLVICSLTGLLVVVTGAYNSNLEGVQITSFAWESGLFWDRRISSFLLTVCLSFFAFTTIIGWNFYSEKCLEYLLNNTNHKQKAVTAFRVFYLLAVFLGSFIKVETVWALADIFNALMAFPNLIALIGLSQTVKKETKEYFDRQNTVRFLKQKK